VKINEAVHVTLFHVGEGRKQDGRGKRVVQEIWRRRWRRKSKHTTRRDRKELQWRVTV